MRSMLPEKFGTAFPNLWLEFVMTDRIVDLAKGQADVAIRAGRPGEKDLIGRKIADSPWAVFASRAYRARLACLAHDSRTTRTDFFNLLLAGC